MKSKLALYGGIGVLVLVAAFALTLGPPGSHEDQDQTLTSVIAQGDDLDAVRDAVLEVGGEITHELGIINAVGADLTQAQLERLNRSGLVRISENRGVSTSGRPPKDDPDDGDDPSGGCSVVGEYEPIFLSSQNALDWEITNMSDSTVTLSNVNLIWPETNGNLIEIQLGGDTVYSQPVLPPSLNLASGWEGRTRDRELRSGGSVKIRFIFELAPLDLNPSNYAITLDFAEGCSVTLTYGEFSSVATFYPELVDADVLHADWIRGDGVTVAVLDTGLLNSARLTKNPEMENRVLATFDALNATEGTTALDDECGHGTHLASIILDAEADDSDLFRSIAPNANMVVVQAFDANGQGTYADVIRGVDWIVQNRQAYDIRVLNCSFSAPAVSCYWDDPLNQAVMAAWQAGIVVVASAGNRGPEPMTIGVPGNVPYVITVGAMTDNYTQHDFTDDYLATFSSAGPTAEGFVKPELVAPGGHMLGVMDSRMTIPTLYPNFQVDSINFIMSGTSQATAVVSGVAALLIQTNPSLTPDEVKSILIGTASPAADLNGNALYSVFQQGAGLVDASRAAYSHRMDFANGGLNIDYDLAGIEHYGGPVNLAEDGSFYIMEHQGTGDGTMWDGTYSQTDAQGLAYLWSDANSLAYLWSDAQSLGQAYLWSDSLAQAYLWSDSLDYAYLWSDIHAYLWSDTLTEATSINVWVPQE